MVSIRRNTIALSSASSSLISFTCSSVVLSSIFSSAGTLPLKFTSSSSVIPKYFATLARAVSEGWERSSKTRSLPQPQQSVIKLQGSFSCVFGLHPDNIRLRRLYDANQLQNKHISNIALMNGRTGNHISSGRRCFYPSPIANFFGG
jgi:hypothetical protein